MIDMKRKTVVPATSAKRRRQVITLLASADKLVVPSLKSLRRGARMRLMNAVQATGCDE